MLAVHHSLVNEYMMDLHHACVPLISRNTRSMWTNVRCTGFTYISSTSWTVLVHANGLRPGASLERRHRRRDNSEADSGFSPSLQRNIPSSIRLLHGRASGRLGDPGPVREATESSENSTGWHDVCPHSLWIDAAVVIHTEGLNLPCIPHEQLCHIINKEMLSFRQRWTTLAMLQLLELPFLRCAIRLSFCCTCRPTFKKFCFNTCPGNPG